MRAQMIYAGQLQSTGDWQLRGQVHPHHELIVVQRGVLHARVAGTAYTARAGDVLFYRAGAEHSEAADPEHGLVHDFLSFSCPDLPVSLPLRLHDAHNRLRQMMAWLRENLVANRLQPGPREEALATAILHEWIGTAATPIAPLVAELRHYMAQHLAETVSLEALAAEAGLTKHHFVRTYHALAGCTPMEDLRRQRLAAAHSLLLSSHLSLKEIADRTGLGTASQLCRLFRRVLGCSPSSLRRSASQA